jgi:hypothetical protein
MYCLRWTPELRRIVNEYLALPRKIAGQSTAFCAKAATDVIEQGSKAGELTGTAMNKRRRICDRRSARNYP